MSFFFRVSRSHVFSNISRILSRCEEEATVDIEALENTAIHSAGHVTMLTEFTDGIDIKVSSRTAMVNSLTDGSTETFWESGDEDRGKMKLITIQVCPETAGFPPRIVCLYVDNSRDMGVSLFLIFYRFLLNPRKIRFNYHVVYSFRRTKFLE